MAQEAEVACDDQPVSWLDAHFPGLTLLRGSYASHRFALHFHDEFAIGVIENGSQRARIGRRADVRMPSGSVVVINPSDVHTGEPDGEAGWTYRMFYWPPYLLREVAWRDLDLPDAFPEFQEPQGMDPILARKLLALHRALEDPWVPALCLDTLAIEALGTLLDHRASARRAVRPPAMGLETLAKAVAYLNDHPADTIRLATLATLSGLSPWHFLRSFKAATGLTPHSFHIQVRIRLAQQQLRARVPSAQVAANLGFADQSHLIRQFRRYVGTTPGRFG